jgi:autoinducer 2 (AI-2) kinase
MRDPLLVAIDCGTGSARALLFDPSGRVVGSGHREWSHASVPGAPGSQCFDTETNWRTISTCVGDALRAADAHRDSVAAISATSMREGMVLYDASGRELWACPNVDARATEEAAELVHSGAAEKIYAQAGDWVSITAPARLRWIARHEPDTFARVAHLGMLGDWVLYKLSGEFVTDPSLGSSSGMFELSTRNWSEEVAGLCNLDTAVLPRVVEPGTVVGELTAAAAQATGLRKGTPVVAGGADTQLALLGAGVVDAENMAIVGGSFWQQAAVLDKPLIDPERRLRTLCHALPNRWMIEGIGFYSGLAMRWFRDAFCQADKLLAESRGLDVYTLLERQATDVAPGAGGLFAIFSNLMNAKKWVHAAPAFVGFDVDAPLRSGKTECFRAIEESAAYVSRGHLDFVEGVTGCAVNEVLFAGGAANGELWPQILADVLDRAVTIPAVTETTAMGAAICAGVGAGLYSDTTSAARELRAVARRIEPNASHVEAYTDLYHRWRTVYDHALELTNTGAVRPLWRAAGTE